MRRASGCKGTEKANQTTLTALTKAEYEEFWEALISAKLLPFTAI